MTSPTFFRWEGAALLVGSLAFAIVIVLSLLLPGPLGPSGPSTAWEYWLDAISGLILLSGVPALYIVQSKRAGLLGLLGVITLFLGMLLLTVVISVLAAIFVANYAPPSHLPQSSLQPPLFVLIIVGTGSLFSIVGSLLFGIAILRTGVFAPWTAWALMVLSVLDTIVGALPPAVAPLLRTLTTILYLFPFIWFGFKLTCQTNSFVQRANELIPTYEQRRNP